MRILHVLDHSLPLQSGYVTRSLGIIRAQRARGWETFHVTTPRHLGTVDLTETIDGLSFTRAPAVVRSLPGVTEILEMRTTRGVVETLARDIKPDIIHAHSPVLNVLPAIAVGRRFGIPVVYEVRAFWEDAAVDHGTTSEKALRYRASRFLDTHAMRRAPHVVTLCEPMRQEILARGVGTERVSVVPNAVDPFFLAEQRPLRELREHFGWSNAFVVGFIGSFYAYEGLDLLLEAAHSISAALPTLKILLVGGGPDEDRLRTIADKLELGKIVHFAGRVPQGQVPDYYAAADLLVYPRRRRRLTELVTPLKPLEAMAQRKPVLASDVGGHRELIVDGQTGFLFPADDIESFVGRLISMGADRSKLEKVADLGRAFVESERNWSAVVERYVPIYASARNASHRPRSST
jgi:PEP-CTERM/exosortase A-associated glycosyltransferase